MVRELTDSGITVYDIGMTLSQICYFACYFFRTRGMIMITASHNPKEYNGFKFGTGYSETMLTEDIVEFRELVKSGKFVTRSPKGVVIQKDIKQDYIDDLKRRIDPIKRFKVVVDSCAATTGIYLPLAGKTVTFPPPALTAVGTTLTFACTSTAAQKYLPKACSGT